MSYISRIISHTEDFSVLKHCETKRKVLVQKGGLSPTNTISTIGFTSLAFSFAYL